MADRPDLSGDRIKEQAEEIARLRAEVATAAVLNKQLGLSFGKVATLFGEHFGLPVAPSAIVRALHRAATKAFPTYVALVQTVRTSPMVVAGPIR